MYTTSSLFYYLPELVWPDLIKSTIRSNCRSFLLQDLNDMNDLPKPKSLLSKYCAVQRTMIQSCSAACSLGFKEILIERKQRRISSTDSKGNQRKNVLNLFSKQTFSQRCEVASWERNSLIFMENPELIFSTSTPTGILPHLSPPSGKVQKFFSWNMLKFTFRCESLKLQVAIIL